MDSQPLSTPNPSLIAPKRRKRPRAWELDFLRGISILLVVIDHMFFDISIIGGEMLGWQISGVYGLENAVRVANNYIVSDIRLAWWGFFVFIFFLVSGICTSFSRNNLLRGLKLAVVALLLSVTMHILSMFDLAGPLWLGVLHCLALCILIYALIELGCKKIKNRRTKKYVVAGISFAVAIIVFSLHLAYNISWWGTPLQQDSLHTSSFWHGIFVYTHQMWNFSALDYFPLFPHLAFFMLGASLGTFLYPNKKSLLPELDKLWHKPITIPGRLSLFLYLGARVVTILIIVVVTINQTGRLF